MTLGRAATNTIPLQERSVSRRHAELLFNGALWSIRDLRSANCTRVNGEAIQLAVLRDGDTIEFGAIRARFQIPVAPERTPQHAARSGFKAKGAAAEEDCREMKLLVAAAQ